MRQKTVSFFIIAALVLSRASFVVAQTLDRMALAADTSTADTTTEPITMPEPDTVPPGFVSIASVSAQVSQATVVWTTDELAYGYVEYGETASYGQATPKSADAALDHTVSITGLAPGTAYHYRIVAQDQSGNIAYSQDRTLETAVEIIAVDNVPPEVSQISVSDVTTMGATISWITDELAQGKIEYGLTEVYGSATPLTSDYTESHSRLLADLASGTRYHYRIIVQDESGNESVSQDEVFTTHEIVPEISPSPSSQPASSPSPLPSSSPTPILFAISDTQTTSVSTSSAIITWTTNEPATGRVAYGQGENYASSTPAASLLVESHQIMIKGLAPATNYFYEVISQNALGQTVAKSGFEFNTLSQKKTVIHAPVISGVSTDSAGTSTARIIWKTDVPSSGELRYGTTTAYEMTDGGHHALLTDHVHTLSGLIPDTAYHLQIIVRDVFGNETIYQDQSFTTSVRSSTLSMSASPSPEEPFVSPEPEQGIAIEKEVPVIVTNDESDVPSNAGGGGGRLFGHRYQLAKPIIRKVEALNRQTLFIWLKLPPADREKIIIVRHPTSYLAQPDAKWVIHRGNSGTFADTGLKNGRMYYYSVFVIDEYHAYSRPLYFSVTPKAKATQAKLVVVPPVIQKTPVFVFPKELKQGDKNLHVEHMQVVLATQSHLYSVPLITGYFGPLTKNAVTKFQAHYQLPQTGVADARTLQKLESLSSVETVKDKADVFDAALPRNLMLGSRGGDVSVLQQFLINVGAYPEALVTGNFGPLTQAALARFQKKQNLNPSSGYFGPLTKKRILNLIRLRSVSF